MVTSRATASLSFTTGETGGSGIGTSDLFLLTFLIHLITSGHIYVHLNAFQCVPGMWIMIFGPKFTLRGKFQISDIAANTRCFRLHESDFYSYIIMASAKRMVTMTSVLRSKCAQLMTPVNYLVGDLYLILICCVNAYSS